MSELVPSAESRGMPWLLAAAGAGAGALLAVAGALWIHYGTAVFFEIARAGIAMCF